MKIINPSTRLYVNGQPLAWKIGIDMLKAIERIGRTCYKSEDKITEDSYETFVRNLIKRGHLSVIEHCSVTADIICDRGVTHEIVRHRIGSYSQESTRYCNYGAAKYGNEITVIDPGTAFEWGDTPAATAKRHKWMVACRGAEIQYLEMLKNGASPQEARSVLPNSLKNETSQEKLAEELDIARTTVSHLENGNREPSLYVLMAYAEYFSVSVDWILYGKEHEE